MPKGIYIKTEEHKRKLRKILKKYQRWRKGEKNFSWKGDKVGYRALHNWVKYWKGSPKICEFCGKKGIGKEINWANINNHQYRRNLNDFISLCVSCHKKYDLLKKFTIRM